MNTLTRTYKEFCFFAESKITKFANKPYCYMGTKNKTEKASSLIDCAKSDNCLREHSHMTLDFWVGR